MKTRVLQYLQTIPKGKVTTYKHIANKFEIHPRAVASIMRYNTEVEKYPCYKVIASSGNISGYNTATWIPEKIAKLETDGIAIINGKVDKKCII